MLSRSMVFFRADVKCVFTANNKNVVLLPEETPIEFKADGEYTQITLPEIVGYSMFRLDK